MSWETYPVIILRELIGDSDSITYTDDKLKRLLAIAAYRVTQEVSFDYTYTINLTDGSEDISPDPSIAPDKDMINLISLKASIILMGAELKSASNDAVLIKDGPSTLDLTKRSEFIKGRLDQAKEEYNDYLKHYMLGNSRSGGSITTPTTVETIASKWFV